MISLTRLNRSAYALPLAFLTAVTMLIISEASFWKATASMDRLDMIAQGRYEVHKLLSLMVDAETGQRGYLLTGRSEYLLPLKGMKEERLRILSWLERYYAEDPKGRAATEQLQVLSERKLAEIDITLRLHDGGSEGTWRDMLLSNIGQQDMEAMRQVAVQLLDAEDRKVGLAGYEVHKTLMLSRVGVATMTLTALLAALLSVRQSRKLDAQRKQQSQAIQAERDQLETEVKRRTLHLIEMNGHLQTVREDERSRLARELHDELGSLLTAAKLDAARIKSRLGVLSEDLGDRFQQLNANLNEVIALKRRIIEDLCPSSLNTLGLVAALDIQSREFASRAGLVVDCRLNPVQLPPSSALTVYRLVQEAFTNIAKYAKARHVLVDLTVQGPHAYVTVQDDGVGFDPGIHISSTHGLLGMRYRVEAEGGQFSVASQPGQGTTIGALLPLSETEAMAAPPTPAVA